MGKKSYNRNNGIRWDLILFGMGTVLLIVYGCLQYKNIKDRHDYENTIVRLEEMKEYIKEFEKNKSVTLKGLAKQSSDIFTLKFVPKKEYAIAIENNNIVALDITLTEDLIYEGYYREITRQIQVARKEADFKIEDRIVLDLSSSDETMQKVISKFLPKIMEETLAIESKTLSDAEFETTFKVNDENIILKISRA